MAKSPVVSIIVPTYNRVALVERAIESVQAQTIRDWELIVMDDGSTDATAVTVQRYVHRDARIRFVQQTNSGMGAARNAAAGVSTGRYLAFLDDDDLWRPHKLQRQLNFLEENPNVDVVFTRIQMINPEGRLLRVLPARWDCSFLGLLERNCIPSPSCVLLRRESFEAAGGFDADLHCSADYDLWLRLAQRQVFACLAEPLVLYLRHPNNLSANHLVLHRDHILGYRKLLAATQEPSLRSRLMRRIAQEWYLLGRVWIERKDYARAGGAFARAILTRPWIGLTLPGETNTLPRTWLRLAKPYLAVGYCALRGLTHVHR